MAIRNQNFTLFTFVTTRNYNKKNTIQKIRTQFTAASFLFLFYEHNLVYLIRLLLLKDYTRLREKYHDG